MITNILYIIAKKMVEVGEKKEIIKNNKRMLIKAKTKKKNSL